MTHSEEEAFCLSRMAELQSRDPSVVLQCLHTVKHLLIGHDKTKELFVNHGLVNRLVTFLQQDGEDWQGVRVEAGICVGSLAYGKPSFLGSSAMVQLSVSVNQ